MKRALFISNQFPYSLSTSVQGVFMRMRVMLEALSAETDELDLLFFGRRPVWLQDKFLGLFQNALNAQWGLRANLTLCGPAIDARNDRSHALISGEQCGAAIERCLEHEPELIFVHRIEAMGPLLSMRRALPPVVFDLDDIEHLKRLRGLFQPKTRKASKLSDLARLPALLRLERRAMQLARSTFVCSERDRRYLTRWLRLPGVEVIVNAVNVPTLPAAAASQSMAIGFIGTFNYRPNVNAAEELITRIWPILRARLPQAKLLVAGMRPDRIPSFVPAPAEPIGERSSDTGIEFAGLVPDVNRFYDRIQLVCCPIRSGGGTRIKIIEAAAYGLPVVATRMAAEGLDFVDGVEIVLSESPGAIARACVDLLSDPARCREIGMAARARAISTYQRHDAVASVRRHLRSLTQTPLDASRSPPGSA